MAGHFLGISEAGALGIAGLIYSLVSAGTGYILYQLNGRISEAKGAIDRANERIDANAEKHAEGQNALRNELQSAISVETAQRIEADSQIERRTSENIAMLTQVMGEHHREIRADIRELRTLIVVGKKGDG